MKIQVSEEMNQEILLVFGHCKYGGHQQESDVWYWQDVWDWLNKRYPGLFLLDTYPVSRIDHDKFKNDMGILSEIHQWQMDQWNKAGGERNE